ncbi:hypothetical protein BCR32DRAFT_325173 [Anaeromyces robustus]|uniref:Dbl homology domain-containing protein n=1 Tax=Anaeromyces robustus TaxID=1754192 RepID=A0A1Y1XJY5_9FUNG|nr:hypothetical protein BCR32DRAFT_325173 [Anaeromyces robustus]|eukprot:ORX86077.1 hypothetical protein BCR32DRAFT_325173 [Anaeromyces robustus]
MSVNDNSYSELRSINKLDEREPSDIFPNENIRPPEAQRNERSIKSMLFMSDEEKQEYARKYFAVKKIENQYKQYRMVADQIIFVQSCLRTKLAKKEYKEMKLIKKLSAQRTQVVMELYATEINYVSNLEKIVNCFMKPLRAIFDESKKGGITKDQIDSIFCNIEDILLKHQEFLKQLKQIVDQWSNETLLSPLFENIHEYISTYIPYFNNYENSYYTIEKCKKVPAFEESIKMVEGVKKLERNDLKSLLILPVQRIPRYILYLKEILKHTWPSHPDYDGLKIEISRIDDDIKILNRWKKFSENKETFELLQSQIKRQNIEVKGKKYVSEGSVLYQYSTMKETLKAPLPTYIYLFNDMLLLTKTSVSKFTRISRLSIIKAIPLTGIQIGELSQTNSPEYQHYLSLTLQDHSILTLYLENNEQKDKWIDDFQRVLYHIHSEMSDLMTIGDDESTFSNSQIISINGEEDKDNRPIHGRLSDVDETAINSPTIKPTSPFKINSVIKKGDEYYSEEDSPRSPEKKKDTVKSKKKGKEKLSPDKDSKGFLSHVKNLIDESKIKFEKGSLDSLESPSDKKSYSKSSRKYKSKDSLNITNLNENDTTIYGSCNSVLSCENELQLRARSRSKKLSLHDTTIYSSQYSVEKCDDDSNSLSRIRDNTETSSVITNDNCSVDTNTTTNTNNNNDYHSIDYKNSNDVIKEIDVEYGDENNRFSRRNGQGNIIIDKNQMNSFRKDKENDVYLNGYDWVVNNTNHDNPSPISGVSSPNLQSEKN